MKEKVEKHNRSCCGEEERPRVQVRISHVGSEPRDSVTPSESFQLGHCDTCVRRPPGVPSPLCHRRRCPASARPFPPARRHLSETARTDLRAVALVVQQPR